MVTIQKYERICKILELSIEDLCKLSDELHKEFDIAIKRRFDYLNEIEKIYKELDCFKSENITLDDDASIAKLQSQIRQKTSQDYFNDNYKKPNEKTIDKFRDFASTIKYLTDLNLKTYYENNNLNIQFGLLKTYNESKNCNGQTIRAANREIKKDCNISDKNYCNKIHEIHKDLSLKYNIYLSTNDEVYSLRKIFCRKQTERLSMFKKINIHTEPTDSDPEEQTYNQDKFITFDDSINRISAKANFIAEFKGNDVERNIFATKYMLNLILTGKISFHRQNKITLSNEHSFTDEYKDFVENISDGIVLDALSPQLIPYGKNRESELITYVTELPSKKK